LIGGLEHSALETRKDIRNKDNQAGVQFHSAEEPNKVGAGVRDECEFIPDGSLGLFSVWLLWLASNPAP
jgi:hypothetical protein